MEEELWKCIPGYNRAYEISNFGRIRSSKFGSIEQKSLRLLNGYYGTTLHLGGVRTTVKVHRMVAHAFIPNPENKPQVNHIDGNKLNNHVSNLEWCTAKENINHAIDTGLLLCIGTDNYQTNLTERDVQIIRLMVKVMGFSYQATADFMEQTKSKIAHIVKGRSFKHLKEDFSGLV